jgi:putative ABC transport system permease protein
MFKNYLKVALRNIIKQKLFSFINIIGLAVGITVCILIYFYVGHERSYDKFHENADRLYRVYITEDLPQRDPFSYVYNPFHLAEALEQSFPEVEQAVRLDVRTDIIRYEENKFSQRVHLVEPEFFEMFTFPLIQGSKQDALKNLNSVVLTQSTAKKIFGQTDPMGQRLSLKVGDSFHDFLVSGIAEDAPPNSSIQFEALISFENVNKYRSRRALDQWFDVFFETYVLLDRSLSTSEIEPKLQTVVKNHYPERSVEMVTLHLQPITDIHLNPDVPSGFEETSDPLYSLILMGIAVLVLMIACVNFMTLALGRSADRVKEVGARKILGALRPQIIKQFLGEALLMSLAALLLSILLVQLFLPTFNRITNQELTFSLGTGTIFFFMALMLVVGSAAGSYPAFVLSSYQPVEVMKGKKGQKRRSIFVRALVVAQFTVSIGLIASTFLMNDQLSFLLNKDIGFEKDNVLVIQNLSAQNRNRQIVERLRNALSKQKEVLGVAGSSSTFARDWTEMGFRDQEGNFKQFFQLTVDYDFIETMGIRLKAGRNFSRDFSTDPREALIVNEAFLDYLNWESAVGKSLPGENFPPHRVIGVVEDFNFQSLRNEVRPAVLVLDTSALERGISDVSTTYSVGNLNFINIRIRPDNVQKTVDLINETWKDIAPQQPFLFSFLDQDVNQQYQEIEHWTRIVVYASGFTVVIACLGLFGLAALSVSRRIKEIGIRKVLGATTKDIVLMLSSEYMKIVVLANIIAWPLSYLVISRWLQDFAYRININLFKFILASFIALIIALITVSYQSLKAGLKDPVESIRHE